MLIPSLRRGASTLVIFCAVVLFLFQHAYAPTKRRLDESDERWLPDLIVVDSLDKATIVARQYISRERGTEDERVVRGVDHFVRDRFKHGFSYTPYHENWILASLGSAPPYEFSVPVNANSILRHRRAMCSQQSIVFMELLKHFGVEYAAVRMDWPASNIYDQGHFAVAAKIDGRWRYYDADLESKTAPPISDVLTGSAVPDMYPNKPKLVQDIRYAAANNGIQVTDLNQHPGPRGLLFQRVTKVASDATPLFMLIVALLIWPGTLQRLIAVWRRNPGAPRSSPNSRQRLQNSV